MTRSGRTRLPTGSHGRHRLGISRRQRRRDAEHRRSHAGGQQDEILNRLRFRKHCSALEHEGDGGSCRRDVLDPVQRCSDNFLRPPRLEDNPARYAITAPRNRLARPGAGSLLLGQIDFEVALTLQQRLVEQSRERDDGQIALLLCEHPTLITVGRGGSPADVAMQCRPGAEPADRSPLGQSRRRLPDALPRPTGHLPDRAASLARLLDRRVSSPLSDRHHRSPRRSERAEQSGGDCPSFRLSENGTVPFDAATTSSVLLCRRLGPHRPIGRLRRRRSPLDDVLRRLSERLSSDGSVSAGQKRSARAKRP